MTFPVSSLSAISRAARLALLLLLVVGASGCSLRHIAADRLGEALGSGGLVFASDDDPELIRAATPFSLKLMESVLAERPQHAALLAATARGYTQFAYAFLQQEADEIEHQDVAAAYRLRERARKLYRRARDYGLRAVSLTDGKMELHPKRLDHRRNSRAAQGPRVRHGGWKGRGGEPAQ